MTSEPTHPENRLQQAHIDARLKALVQLMARKAVAEDYAARLAEDARENKKGKKP